MTRSALTFAVLAPLLALLFAPPARGAFELSWPDARSAAMAGCECLAADVLTFSDVTTEESCRAWLVRLSGGELYGLREARGWRVQATRSGSPRLAFEASGFGAAFYRERAAGVFAGLDVDGGFRLDVGIRALGLSIDGTDDAWAASVDARLDALLLGRLGLTGRWWNVGRSSIEGWALPSPGRLTASLSLEGFLLAVSVLVEAGFDPSPSLGVEFAANRWLRLRAGSGTRPGRFAAGLGVAMSRGSPAACLDVAWEWHPDLGGSVFASVSLVR